MLITFIAYGTRGDVQPALALGRALRARGHQVRLLASLHFKPWIEGHGITAVPASVDVQALMTSELGNEWAEIGTQPFKQLRLMKKMLDEHGLAMIQDAWHGCQGSDLIVSSFTSMNYAPCLAQALRARHVIILLQPPTLASRSGSATLSAPLPRRNSWINYLFGKWLLERAAWWLYGGVINRFRREALRRPPQTQRENVADWKGAPILLGFSPQVVPPPADWPPNVHVTGYWFLDEDAGWAPPARLSDFLEAGEPPVCIGFGSMAGRGRDAFNRLLLEAARQSGRRAVLLAGWAGLGDAEMPDNVLALESAPHGWLFPRVATVVHHGGAGTTAAAFRAGTPQVVVPHLADQPFWGQCVEMLGVGPGAIPRPKLTAANLSTAIRVAASDAGMRQRAGKLSERIRAEDGVAMAVRLIERAK
jgi:sterol 3beta-glucosyltransferase